MKTLFSSIIAGEIPSYKIYEDAYTYAFLDIHPLAPGHTLVVPKIEVDHFYDLPQPYYEALFATVKHIAPVLQYTFQAQRCSMIVAGFDVPHVHIHLVPANSAAVLDFSQAQSVGEDILKQHQALIHL
jgi:histidine triad (HIT) family protein